MGLADKFISATKKQKGAGQFSKVLEEPKEYHDTGVYALNLAYSGDLTKGTSDGVTCIAGKSKSFKTLFGLMSCKAYLDANPEGHGGETREDRINEFLVVNQETIVAGLREGTMFLVEDDNIYLIGERSLRIFQYGKEPKEYTSDDDINFLLG